MSAWSDRQAARSSLRAWHRFGESSGTTLVDAAAGPDGTYAGSGVTLGQAGLVADDADTAAAFDGSSDAASVPDDAALDVGNGPWTIKGLAQRTRSGQIEVLLNKGISGGVGAYLLRYSSTDRLELMRSGGLVVVRAIAGAAIADADRHHLAVSRSEDGSVTKLFIDGVDVTVAVNAETFSDTGTALRIGHEAAGTRRFAGTMDEWTIDDVELSPTYIAEDASIARSLYGSATLDGELALAASGAQVALGAAALSGEASIAAAGAALLGGQADLAAELGLAAAGVRAAFGSAGLDAVASLEAAGAALLGGQANLSGEASIAAVGVLLAAGAALLEGVAELDALGVGVLTGSGTLAAELGLTAAGARAVAGAAALDGELGLAAAGTRATGGAAMLAAELGLLGAGSVRHGGTAALAAELVLSAAGRYLARGAAALSGELTLAAIGEGGEQAGPGERRQLAAGSRSGSSPGTRAPLAAGGRASTSPGSRIALDA